MTTILKYSGLVAVVISLWALFGGPNALITNGAASFGATAAGNLLAENYIPYILYNQGYNSNKDISTSANLYGAIVNASASIAQNSTSGVSTTTITSQALTAATTTPCNLQSPFSLATSTVSLNFNVTTATSAPAQLVVATSTSMNATTSTIGLFGFGISQQQTLSLDQASSTGRIIVVGPSGWVNVGSTATSSIPYTLNGVYTFGGTCTATWKSVL